MGVITNYQNKEKIAEPTSRHIVVADLYFESLESSKDSHPAKESSNVSLAESECILEEVSQRNSKSNHSELSESENIFWAKAPTKIEIQKYE